MDIHTELNIASLRTTHLVENVIRFCARHLDIDLSVEDNVYRLYSCCCDLEDFPADEGFGSSDHYPYLKAARREFGLDKAPCYCDACRGNYTIEECGRS